MTIYKYALRVGSTARITLPVGAELLHFAAFPPDPEVIHFWAKVDPEAETETRRFTVYGTGMGIRDDENYCGTVLAAGGALVWHVFEAPNG